MQSTLAAETLALLDCSEAAINIAFTIKEITGQDIPVSCFVDNKSLVDSVYSSKNVESKRLRIDIAVIRNMLTDKEIQNIYWIPTFSQLANCLTKRGANADQLRAAISNI